MMPPDKREAMVHAMVEPMMANIQAGFQQSPQLARAFAEQPKAQALMQAFMARQTQTSLQMLGASLPALVAAMQTAYARQFTASEMAEAQAFYLTPTGQAFLNRQAAVMNDPAVAAVQRDMMTRAMAKVQTDVADLVAQLSALEPAPALRK